jgi:hypothetical protein
MGAVELVITHRIPRPGELRHQARLVDAIGRMVSLVPCEM